MTPAMYVLIMFYCAGCDWRSPSSMLSAEFGSEETCYAAGKSAKEAFASAYGGSLRYVCTRK